MLNLGFFLRFFLSKSGPWTPNGTSVSCCRQTRATRCVRYI